MIENYPGFYKVLKFTLILIFKNNLIKSHTRFINIDEDDKFKHLFEGINYLKVAGILSDNNEVLPQTYFEFGCHSARTFSSAINAVNYLKMKNFKFYALDSFKGLPTTNVSEDGIFKKGEFSTSKNNFIRLVKKYTNYGPEKYNIIEGYFEDSLTKDLKMELPKIGVVFIDVDLYSSTKTVLEFIKDLLVEGSLVIFDDWYCFPESSNQGQKKAFDNFCQENNLVFKEWKNFGNFGKSFFLHSK